MVKLGDEEAESQIPQCNANFKIFDSKFKMKNGVRFETVKSVGDDKDWKWHFETCSGLVFAGYTVCYIAYVAIGGLIFMYVEGGNNGDDIFKKVQAIKANVLKKFPNTSGEALDDFISELSSNGVGGLQTLDAAEEKWSFSEGVFFCITLLTTIGYGHVAPVSQLGKAICMIYTAFGIPFTLVLLASFVHRMMTVAYSVQRAMSACLDGVLKPLRIRVLFLTLAAVSVGIMFFFIPALMFSHLEKGWTFLDGLYFCFISLTTVGLGDLVPGRNSRVHHVGLYRLGMTCYLLAGVTALMFLMALLTQLQECVFKRLSKVKKAPYAWRPPTYGSIVPERTMLITELKAAEIKRGYR